MAEAWPVHTVVFDLDDTLYPESEFVRSGFCAVDKWLSREKGITGFADRANALFDSGCRGRIFDEALSALGHWFAPTLVAEMLGVYRTHAPRISLPAESREVLDWVADRFAIGLITDGYATVQRLKLASLGLERWSPQIVVTDELGREFWKPHPAAFEQLMARSALPQSGYVYVADNPKKDFIAPKRLGWRTIRFLRTGGEHAAVQLTPDFEAEETIRDLRLLTKMLAPIPSCS